MINNVVLVGRLTKDPDLRFTQTGTAVATFTLAVDRQFKNQDGNKEVDFITCVIWRKSAEALANYTRKGSLIGVVGRIQTRNYENQQGQKVYVTEVICETFKMLENKKNDNERGQTTANASNQSFSNNYENKQQKQDSYNYSTGNKSQINISDDDLPF